MQDTDSRYRSVSKHSLVEKFSPSPDPWLWTDKPEQDDELHTPDPKRDRLNDTGDIFTLRAASNLGCLALLVVGILTLFAGYPLISFLTKKKPDVTEGINTTLGANSSGIIPTMPGVRGMIDPDTPAEFHTKPSYVDGTSLQLVFSDEFEKEGRSFYPGDDPYWTAADLYYWQTNDLEWYDPSAVTTRNGSLELTLSAKATHNLTYQSGMVQSWNQMCFTGGLVEVSVRLPGTNNIPGLWPAVWTMGNLGRAGYGASLDGMWPYTYSSCDVGTVANQSYNGVPDVSMYPADKDHDNLFSYLPGQRLSACTCEGESHPGPKMPNGTFVGRSAPEIDIFEAQTTGNPPVGAVSQSGQWAPFNAGYEWFNTTENLIIPNPDITELNTYLGGVYQQATSSVTQTDQNCYELTGGCHSVYGYEYKPGYEADGGFITWISNDQVAWTMKAAGVGADSRVNTNARPIPQEPMYILMNLGISTNFIHDIPFAELTFPTRMAIDYVRVYQHPDNINYGCNPSDFPTEAYINQYIEAYTNPNHTTWADFGQPMPKNSFLGQCDP